MLSLEAYIARRKSEDGLNDWDMNKRNENLRICVNYVFEYFNNYLETSPAEGKTALLELKLDKYRKTLNNYDPEIQEWLVNIYSEHGKYMHRQIGNMINDVYFLLYDTEAEFRALSYDIYSKIEKKFPFMKGNTEMLFLFLKDYHRIQSIPKPYEDFPFICETLNGWIEETYKKYNVNVLNFAEEWIGYFSSANDVWPSSHKVKNEYYGKPEYKKYGSVFYGYDYNYKQKSNLFNIDSLYLNMPKKKFTKGRKQEFEILFMHDWLTSISGDDDNYWETYLAIVLPYLK